MEPGRVLHSSSGSGDDDPQIRARAVDRGSSYACSRYDTTTFRARAGPRPMTNRRRRIRPRLRPAEAVRLRARGAPDLLAVIPFLLGFHPRESVVTVFVRSGRIILTARLDLPPPEASAAYAEMLRRLIRQHGGDEIVVLGYSAQPEPARAFLSRLLEELPPELVNEALYADGSRWWSMSCDGPCCPAEGTPYAVDSHPLAAEAVLAGKAVRADRDATRRAGPRSRIDRPGPARGAGRGAAAGAGPARWQNVGARSGA